MRTTPTLELANVRFGGKEPNRFMIYSYRGGFLIESEAKLLWLPAELPEPPTAEEFGKVLDPKVVKREIDES